MKDVCAQLCCSNGSPPKQRSNLLLNCLDLCLNIDHVCLKCTDQELIVLLITVHILYVYFKRCVFYISLWTALLDFILTSFTSVNFLCWLCFVSQMSWCVFKKTKTNWFHTSLHIMYCFIFSCWSHLTSLFIACSHSEKVVWKSR